MSTQASANPISFLYNHNPFYFLGTLAVLFGLHSLQAGPSSGTILNPLILPATLAVFVVGLTVIGVSIVRFGGVWEDARSIFLSILLIAFAVSVCIDTFCLSQPWQAAKYSVGALLFFIGISESIIRGVGIKFPAGYRVPFYNLLGLMFLYPLVFAANLVPINPESTSWLIYGFSIVVSLGILTLLPAVAGRQRYVANNGTPWSWPAYPWSIFAFLFAALVLRACALSFSFLPMEGLQTTIAGYFAVPPILALMLLALQNELAKGEEGDTEGVMYSAVWLVGLASIPVLMSSQGTWFASRFTETIGSPIWVSIAGLTVFYSIAWWCRAGHAKGWLVFSLILLGLVPNASLTTDSIGVSRWIPMLVASSILIHAAWNANCTAKLAWSCLPMVAAVFLACRCNTQLPTLSILLVCAGTFVFAIYSFSLLRDDLWAKRFLACFAFGLPASALCLSIAYATKFVSTPTTFAATVTLAVASLLAAVVTRYKLFWYDAAMIVPAAAVGFLFVQTRGIASVPMNARIAFWSAVFCLAGGVCISCSKAGWLSSTKNKLRVALDELRQAIEERDARSAQT